ncbi:hypothetical protein Baya_7133 [Bagarius yarrelli]|uniref:Uncharacterized protein n=1 Tax=Bagarius yarrelli TaxID=175774 RepID=A0A556TZD3_BAGYA|nr:hypothetical protein Baya_7133 [Bagarius yarrelli]
MKLAQLVRILIKQGPLFIRCQAAGLELGSTLAVLEPSSGMFLLNITHLYTGAEHAELFDVSLEDNRGAGGSWGGQTPAFSSSSFRLKLTHNRRNQLKWPQALDVCVSSHGRRLARILTGSVFRGTSTSAQMPLLDLHALLHGPGTWTNLALTLPVWGSDGSMLEGGNDKT